MAPKRPSMDAELPLRRVRQSSAKRNKLSSPPPLAEESSVASTDSSAETTLSPDTDPTSVSSSGGSIAEHGSGTDSDSETAQDSSSVEGETDAEYEEESERDQVTSLSHSSAFAAIGSKPNLDPNVIMAYAKELEARLHAFLPKLRQANSKLSEQSAKLNMERVDEDEQHIEMNLDLGVLEQQQPSDVSRAAGDIKLPGDHNSKEAEPLLPPDMSIGRLLNGGSEKAGPNIEVLQPGDIAQRLPQGRGSAPT